MTSIFAAYISFLIHNWVKLVTRKTTYPTSKSKKLQNKNKKAVIKYKIILNLQSEW